MSDARIRDLLDREEISRCIAKSARGMDRYDVALAKAAFWPDATDDHGRLVPAYDYIDARTKVWKSVQHNLTTQTVELGRAGDPEGAGEGTAHAETYFIAMIRPAEEDRTEFTVGRYIDRLTKRGDEWRIAHRLTIVQWSGLALETGENTVIPGMDLFAKGTLDESDASYLRPLTSARPASA
jgi:hypothetical protein